MDEDVYEIGPVVALSDERYARLGPYHCRGCGERMRKWRLVTGPEMPNRQGRCPSCLGQLFATDTSVREID